MPLIHTANVISDLQDNPRPPPDIAGAKSVGSSPILITSTEITSSCTSESLSEDDAESFGAREKSGLRSAELSHTKQAELSIDPARNLSAPHTEVFTAVRILQVIETYGVHHRRADGPWRGLAGYVPLVTEQIRAGEPVRLLFSGFGFKSPQTSGKVLGTLPDLGEKLALGHLNGLCSNIFAIYKNGAEVQICSDGLACNDLFGVPDDIVWEYGNALRNMAESNNLQHLSFAQLGDVLGHESGVWTKEYTVVHGSCLRRELLYQYTDAACEPDLRNELMDERIRNCLTNNFSFGEYEGDVQLVRSLRARLNAFASALEANKAEYVKLSSNGIDSSRGGNTLTISFASQDIKINTLAPWHSAIAIELDGRYRATFANELQNTDAYELIYNTMGAPSHYRAKVQMWDWKADGLNVTFEHQYPTGTIIRPDSSYIGTAPSIRAIPMRKVRLLSQTFSPIILRGFSETTKEEHFLAKGHELGEILTWTFGQILKVKDSGEVDRNANNVTSNEAMPMHFDGIFKFVDTVDRVTGEVKKVLTPPRYQYFTCLSTAPKGDGYTLFANSRLFFEHLPLPFTLQRLEKVTWSMVNDGFWSAKQTELPLVVRHKETGAACLRWHEPWTKTKFSKYYIEIENDDAAEELVEVINKSLYDHRICLRFEWEQGDLLINDNVSMLHTRTAFVGNCEREMWRIHFD